MDDVGDLPEPGAGRGAECRPQPGNTNTDTSVNTDTNTQVTRPGLTRTRGEWADLPVVSQDRGQVGDKPGYGTLGDKPGYGTGGDEPGQVKDKPGQNCT